MPGREKLQLGRQKKRPSPKPKPKVIGPDASRWERARDRWKRRHAAKKRRLAKLSRPRRIARRIGVTATWFLALIAAMLVAAVVLFYTLTDVPKPENLALPQVATILYADGSVMAHIGTVNRTSVPLSDVPVPVRYDVLAAEDRNFYSEPGVSIKGTVRAALSDLTGSDVQGGSGITQQYVKNAYLSDSRTLTRKLKELMIAVKLARDYSKDQILEFYLNTVYFGRGAYGIQAAAMTYFNIDASKLNVSQGAMLAALLRAPSYYDPAVNPTETKARWAYVIAGMVTTKHLTQAQADALKFPKVQPVNETQLGATGPTALIVQQVENELEANGVSAAEINTRGLVIKTTIDPSAQTAAVNAIDQAYANPNKDQANLQKAFVAENPATGGVLAYYGGSNGTGLDYAQAWRQPGSTFKPYVLAAALTQNLKGITPAYTINSVFDGSSPQLVDGFQIHNDPSDPTSGYYSLRQAMTLSLNTIFYKLASDIGPKSAAAIAHAAGIPTVETASGPDPGAKTLQDASGNVGDKIGIGGYEVRPIDQATGFATIADNGVAHPAYFVQQVTDSSGAVIYTHKSTSTKAMDPKVANDTTLAMEQVAASSGIGVNDGRAVAAKTGTVGIANSPNASDAWTVGFTPQVSAASWVGSNTDAPIYNDQGLPMYGRNNAGIAWQLFMNAYLVNKPALPMATTQMVGVEAAPPTTATPTPTNTPSPSKTPPSPTRTPRTTPAPASSSASGTATSSPPPSPSPSVCTTPLLGPPTCTPVPPGPGG